MSSIAIDAEDGVSIEKIFWAELHGTWLNHESNSPDTKSCVRNQSLPMRAKSQQPQNITTKTSLTTLNPKRIISLALKAWKEARPTVWVRGKNGVGETSIESWDENVNC